MLGYSLELQASQGEFVKSGRQDPLTVALGTDEHPGRVRAMGRGHDIRRQTPSEDVQRMELVELCTKAEELKRKSKLTFEPVMPSHHHEFTLTDPNSLSDLCNKAYRITSSLQENLVVQMSGGIMGNIAYDLHLESEEIVSHRNKHFEWKETKSFTKMDYMFGNGNENLSIHFPSTRWNSSLSLSYLDLSYTGCPPNIIESLRNLSRVKFLGLANCGLSGKISETILDLEQLTTLDLSDNSLKGGFPDLFIKLWRLKRLFLSDNSITAQFPSSITNITQLEALDLSYNSLYGTIPSWLFDLSTLYKLNLRYNQLQGPIPTSLSKQKNLIILDLSSNNFSGPVELNMFSNLKRIVDLRLSNNRLSLVSNPLRLSNNRLSLVSNPKINSNNRLSLVSNPKINSTNLANNSLSGAIPQCLGNSSEFLEVLSLRSNHFHGTISNSTTKHLSSQLKIIDLSHNEFTGNLPVWLFKSFTAMKNTDEARKPPTYFGDQENYYTDSLVLVWKGNQLNFEKILTVYTTIDLSSNKFEGKIPGAIGQFLSLRGLNLSHNMLCGSIPRSFGKLSLLESLDLSSNQLVGEIPKELAPLTFLSVFKLSHNHLTGCIPKGNQFNTFEKSSYEGNDGLRGYPMTKDCGNGVSSKPPTLEVLHQEDNVSILYGFTWKVVLLGYGCGTVFGVGFNSTLMQMMDCISNSTLVDEIVEISFTP
ncbi:receptor-like protein 9DC3 [Ipomoea triloba]|uniref:receptor-like protein 9DC3 n=1 Tax=Ipomoea triloba TaxID=35885 RepID=UPI00125D591B|nr:receptor-like protein 9DC3 [Ipomoea triloba]